MLAIPILDDAAVAFGDIKHVPKRDALPEEYQKQWHSGTQPYCHAVSQWFYSGARKIPGGVAIDGVRFIAKPGVDANAALRAIKACLGSFEPKHEHKIGACGFMLSEWFDMEAAKTK